MTDTKKLSAEKQREIMARHIVKVEIETNGLDMTEEDFDNLLTSLDMILYPDEYLEDIEE